MRLETKRNKMRTHNMTSKVADNKRIAKNTAFLYVRTLVILFISFYTSRIVLDQLGDSDFGLYNVVGSLVMLFTFIQGSLTSTISRFFSFEIGGGNKESLNKVFCTAMNVHIIYAVIVFLLAETIGLWYVQNKMVIPMERITAATTVYHISTLSAVITILTVPFSAMIIAQEKMKAFAYISIFESLTKLGTALYLEITSSDKLIVFGLSLFAIQMTIQFLNMAYCKRNFSCTRYKLLWDKNKFKEIFVFAGWTLISYSASIVNQATNLLLNAFFGPVVNAARAVAYQVQNNVTVFVTNFQIAINPQIIKNYAGKDMERVYDLVDMSTKISFSLLFILMFPLLVNLDFALNLWLKKVPDDTPEFIILISILTLLSIMQNPLNVVSEAANKLKKYNIVNSIYNLSQIPICYMALKITHNVYLVFIIQIAFCFVSYFIRLRLINGFSQIPMRRPFIVYSKTVLTIIVSLIGGHLVMTSIESSVAGFFIKCAIITMFTIPWSYFFILDRNDRTPLNSYILKKIHRQ